MDSWSLSVAAALVLVYAGLSRRLERTPLTAAIFFVTAERVTGGDALGWFDLKIGSGAVRALAEVTSRSCSSPMPRGSTSERCGASSGSPRGCSASACP